MEALAGLATGAINLNQYALLTFFCTSGLVFRLLAFLSGQELSSLFLSKATGT